MSIQQLMNTGTPNEFSVRAKNFYIADKFFVHINQGKENHVGQTSNDGTFTISPFTGYIPQSLSYLRGLNNSVFPIINGTTYLSFASYNTAGTGFTVIDPFSFRVEDLGYYYIGYRSNMPQNSGLPLDSIYTLGIENNGVSFAITTFRKFTSTPGFFPGCLSGIYFLPGNNVITVGIFSPAAVSIDGFELHIIKL